MTNQSSSSLSLTNLWLCAVLAGCATPAGPTDSARSTETSGAEERAVPDTPDSGESPAALAEEAPDESSPVSGSEESPSAATSAAGRRADARQEAPRADSPSGDDAAADSEGVSMREYGVTEIEADPEVDLEDLPDIGAFLREQVRPSVLACEKKHSARRDAKSLGKITVAVELSSDGSLASYRLDPKEVRDTAFGRCLDQERRDWSVTAYRTDAIIEVSDNYHLVR
jgi:hypothetical protein